MCGMSAERDNHQRWPPGVQHYACGGQDSVILDTQSYDVRHRSKHSGFAPGTSPPDNSLLAPCSNSLRCGSISLILPPEKLVTLGGKGKFPCIYPCLPGNLGPGEQITQCCRTARSVSKLKGLARSRRSRWKHGFTLRRPWRSKSVCVSC